MGRRGAAAAVLCAAALLGAAGRAFLSRATPAVCDHRQQRPPSPFRDPPLPPAAAAARLGRTAPAGSGGSWHYYSQDAAQLLNRPRECPSGGAELRLSAAAVRKEQQAHNWTRLLPLCCGDNEADDSHGRRVLYRPAGREHYALLAHLARRLHEQGGGLIVELGVREGMSSVALGQHRRNALFSFDLHDPAERLARALRRHGGPAGAGPEDALAAAGNVHFVRANVLAPEHSRWRAVLAGAALVLLDTAHVPEKHPFEYDVALYLDHAGFSGTLVLDDIHVNPQMERFWGWVRARHGSAAADATKIGHASGTGLVNFCGNATVTA